MKKGKEWLRDELMKFKEGTSGRYEDVIGVSHVMRAVDQLDEPEKVVIPKFVAEWYEGKRGMALYNILKDLYNLLNSRDEMLKQEKQDEIVKWYSNCDGRHLSRYANAQEIIAKMELFGYEIEKEKLYQVIIPTKDTNWEYYYLDLDGGIDMANHLSYVDWLTEEFIRSVSDDLMQFAVEVAE